MMTAQLAGQVTAYVVGGYIALLVVGMLVGPLVGRALSMSSVPGDGQEYDHHHDDREQADGDADADAVVLYRDTPVSFHDRDRFLVELLTTTPGDHHAYRRRSAHPGE